MAIEILNKFDKGFRDELLTELVELNREALTIVKEELKNESKWVSIKVLVEKTGRSRKELERLRDQGMFRCQRTGTSINSKYLYDLIDVQRVLRKGV
ncbi:hypothetical protein [Streptococcus gallolyticus]|uniref:hypothetical protein n=1 Tax=Streptococcus gallolyticus TaxID=315405 RepID=UPI000E404EF3|nr:hypothetical protein [Streptococcus gallolyticus]RGC38172.1 hypothetical protein DXD73_08480 [Streptococcus gallolyticus]